MHSDSCDGLKKTEDATFYCGCCVLALGYLLERSIIYRDLKDELRTHRKKKEKEISRDEEGYSNEYLWVMAHTPPRRQYLVHEEAICAGTIWTGPLVRNGSLLSTSSENLSTFSRSLVLREA